MSEKEKRTLETLAEKIGMMSDFDKGYILGVAEKAAMDKAEEEEKENG